MQVRCVRARAGVKVGDTAEVPDGAAVSDLYWEPVAPPFPAAPAATPGPASTPPPSLPVSSAPAKEGSTS